MKSKKYCLLYEPWIRVIDDKARISEVSLIELFGKAHLYKDLAGEITMQNIAVLRFLLAIVNTVFIYYDKTGNERKLVTPDDVLDYYEEVWNNQKFPEDAFIKYLTKWEDCFWLVHPEKPFYQVPERIGEKIGTQCGASKLNGEMFESNNQIQLFASRSGKKKNELTFPEATRWLLFINAFDDCAAKNPSPKECWVSKLGLTVAKGDNLFETLMLNCQMLTINDECWPENTPSWEKTSLMDYDLADIKQIPQPFGLAELFTVRSRRVCLNFSDEDTVTGYRITAGVTFEGKNYFSEPMTPWHHIEAKKNDPEYWVPQKYDFSKKVWQEFPTLLSVDDDNCAPGIVRWVNMLQREDVGILNKDKCVSFEVCSVYYGSMSCKISNEVHDSISFHVGLLDRTGKVGQKLIQEMVNLVEKTSNEIGRLAGRISAAAGDKANSENNNAREEFFYRIDPNFRNWVHKITGNDSVSLENARTECRNMIKKTAMKYAEEIIHLSSETAFVGREVTIKKNGAEEKKYHNSVPEAYNIFLREISKLFDEGGR